MTIDNALTDILSVCGSQGVPNIQTPISVTHFVDFAGFDSPVCPWSHASPREQLQKSATGELKVFLELCVVVLPGAFHRGVLPRPINGNSHVGLFQELLQQNELEG